MSLWNQAAVAVVDTEARQVVRPHPDPGASQRDAPGAGGKVLYVANANRNTVTVIDTAAGKAGRDDRHGDRPHGPGGLHAQLAGALARRVGPARRQRQHQQPGRRQREGAGREHAAGVHPDRLVSHLGPGLARRQDDLRRQRQGGELAGQPRRPQPGCAGRRGTTPRVHRRAVPGHALDHPDARARRRWRVYSQTVYECSPLQPRRPDGRPRRQAPAPGTRSPAKVGDPSPIKYCIYIIKENRTYDQVFGDMPEGNGDPNLCLFPEAVTPNHHALAREFVLLDNFYVDGEVSADGHEWTMGAYATDFVERTWPLSYRGDRRVPYPVGGRTSPIARPAAGYLWDRAAEKGVSYRSYGEFIKNGKTPGRARRPRRSRRSRGTSTRMFRSYDLDYPDVKRAERFLEELAGFEKAGEMPRLIDPAAAQRPHRRAPSPASRPSRPAWPTTTWRSGRWSRG